MFIIALIKERYIAECVCAEFISAYIAHSLNYFQIMYTVFYKCYVFFCYTYLVFDLMLP